MESCRPENEPLWNAPLPRNDDPKDDPAFPGPYWHGDPSSVRMLNIFHFIYRQYGFEFRPSHEDLVFYEWIGATNRLSKWVKWKTANMLARAVGSLDLVGDPFGSEEWPGWFDYYRREDRYGLTRTDQGFHRMKLRRKNKNRYVPFIFSLYQGKAASLPPAPWEIEQNVKEAVQRLSTEKALSGELQTFRGTLTAEKMFSEIDRALDEFCPPTKRTRKIRHRLPGRGACFESSRANGGAAALLLERYMGYSACWYSYLDSFYEGPLTAVEVRRGYTLDDLEEGFRRLYVEALGQDAVAAVPVGLPEPFKVRVITKGAAAPYAVARSWQPTLWGALKRHPVFRLIGEPLTPAIIRSFLHQADPNREMWWISGDYKQATDHIPSEVSEYILEGMCSRLGIPTEDTHILLAALTRHDLHWGGSRYSQASGQLMGSPVSFPVLNVWNFVLTRTALEHSHREPRIVEPEEILVNGDDLLFGGDLADYLTWKAVVRWGGLLPSVGKTLVSREYLTINSQIYKVGRRQAGCFSDPVMGDSHRIRNPVEIFVPTRLPHVQLQLATGSMKSGHVDLSGRVRAVCSPATRSKMWHDFLDSCPRKEAAWKFLWRTQASYLWSLRDRFPTAAFCAPLEAGGMGFPLPPPSSPFFKNRAPGTRALLLARMLLESGTPEHHRLRARWAAALRVEEDSPSSSLLYTRLADYQARTGCPLLRTPIEAIEQTEIPPHLMVEYFASPLRECDVSPREVRRSLFARLRNELRRYTSSGRGPMTLSGVMTFLSGSEWSRRYGRFSSRTDFGSTV